MSLNSFRTGLGGLAGNPVAKWVLFGVGALLAFSLVFSGLGNNLGRGGAAGGGPSPTDVVATVNGDPITRDDFTRTVSVMRRRPESLGRTVSVYEEPVINSGALDQLTNATLLMQEAKRRGITVSQAEVNALRAQVAEGQGLRQTLNLPATASLADVDAALTRTGSPTLEQSLPDDTLRQAIILGDGQHPGKLVSALVPAPSVTEADVRQSYLKYHTRHILVGNKARSDVQARSLAQQILAKAKAPGADFAALAKQYSDDPGTKAKGGDDGPIGSLTPYVPEFKQAAFSLKPGQVTPDLVASPQYGYFIIKLDGVQNTLPADFDKNKAKYVAQYTQAVQQNALQEAQGKLQTLIAGLRASAKIDVKDPALAGDSALALASRQGDPAKAHTQYQQAVAHYQDALKGAGSASDKATLEASLGQAYQNLRQTPQAIDAYAAAAKLRPDAALELSLGKLYQDNKDTANALTHYQAASKLAYNDQSTHTTLLSTFRQLGRADLADGELAWLKQYAKDHPQTGGPSGFPGMTLPGGPPTGQPAGSVHIQTPNQAPNQAAPAPGR